MVRPAAVPAATATPSVSPSPSGSATPTVAESGHKEEADPAVAAEAWVQAWLNTSGPSGKPDKAAWLARLQPITDPPLYAGLAQTDIAQVPGGGKGVVQPGTRLSPIPGQADVTARVTTTAGQYDVTMTMRNEQWIVTLNDQAR